jgi:hypothetical protein
MIMPFVGAALVSPPIIGGKMAAMNGTTTPEEAEVSNSPEELYIRDDIYEAAMKRATQQGETLASVVRSAYYLAALEAVPVAGGKGLIKPRPYGEERTRVRFQVPLEKKRATRAKIESSGVSVPSAVENLLRRYIETGTTVGVAAVQHAEAETTDTTTESE